MASRLLSIPHELTSEIIAHLASSLPHPHLRSQSHFDAYSQHKLSPSALKDLQHLALTHTHLLPFCRSLLFRTMRVYPGMAVARVEALTDLFYRTPDLARAVKEIWWTIGVEEYRGKYEWFRWRSEEKEVRKAEQRLALVDVLSRARIGGGLRKLWVTGCESQRRYDAAQRQSGELVAHYLNYSPLDAEAEMGFARVLGNLEGLLACPALRYLSFVNVAFPGELLRRCVNLAELRLGEDVKVQVSRDNFSFGSKVEGEGNRAAVAVRPRVLTLPCQMSRPGADAGPSVLFEKEWAVFKDDEDNGVVFCSDPVLDLSNLQTLSCQYPSTEFSAVMHNLSLTGNGRELREVVLQVSDFGALVDDTNNGTFDIPEGRPLDRLSLKCTLPSSNAPRTPNIPASMVNQHLPSAIAAPSAPTLSDRVSQLLTSLATSFDGTRNVDVEFTASLEVGVAILGDGAPGGLDLVPLARKLSASSSLSSQCLPRSITVHFSMVPGCYSSYAYSGHNDEEGVMSKKAVIDRHVEAMNILKNIGVQLNVGYDVVV